MGSGVFLLRASFMKRGEAEAVEDRASLWAWTSSRNLTAWGSINDDSPRESLEELEVSSERVSERASDAMLRREDERMNDRDGVRRKEGHTYGRTCERKNLFGESARVKT